MANATGIGDYLSLYKGSFADAKYSFVDQNFLQHTYELPQNSQKIFLQFDFYEIGNWGLGSKLILDLSDGVSTHRTIDLGNFTGTVNEGNVSYTSESGDYTYNYTSSDLADINGDKTTDQVHHILIELDAQWVLQGGSDLQMGFLNPFPIVRLFTDDGLSLYNVGYDGQRELGIDNLRIFTDADTTVTRVFTLDIASALGNHATETLSLEISNVPTGVTLSDANGLVLIPSDIGNNGMFIYRFTDLNESHSLTDELANLQVTVLGPLLSAEDIVLTLTATAIELNVSTETIVTELTLSEIALTDDVATTDEKTPIQVDVLSNDQIQETYPIQFSITDVSSNHLDTTVSLANFTVQNNQILFNPLDDFLYLTEGNTEELSISYQVKDLVTGVTDTATLALTVNGIGGIYHLTGINDQVTAPYYSSGGGVKPDGGLTFGFENALGVSGYAGYWITVDPKVYAENHTLANTASITLYSNSGFETLALSDISYVVAMRHPGQTSIAAQQLYENYLGTDDKALAFYFYDASNSGQVTVTKANGEIITANAVVLNAPITPSTIFGDIDIVENNNIGFMPMSNFNAKYGTFSIDEQGIWSYQVDTFNPKVVALTGDQSLSEDIVISTQDGFRETASITIVGNAGNAIKMLGSMGTIVEDQVDPGQVNPSYQGNIGGTPLHSETITGQYGTLSIIDSSGNYTYTLDNNKVQDLISGVSLSGTAFNGQYRYALENGNLTFVSNYDNSEHVRGMLYSLDLQKNKIDIYWGMTGPHDSMKPIIETYPLDLFPDIKDIIKQYIRTELFSITAVNNEGYSYKIPLLIRINGSTDAPLLSAMLGMVIEGGDGIIGASQDDALYGTASNDTLRGGAGDDTLYGLGGNDLLYGEGLARTISLNIESTMIDGYASAFKLVIKGIPEGVSLNHGTKHGDGSWIITDANKDGSLTEELQNLTLTVPGGELAAKDITLSISAIQYQSDGTFVTTNAMLSVLQSIGNDILVGGDGNDQLYGQGGSDILYGDSNTFESDNPLPIESASDGNDRLVGGASADILYGGGGEDILFGDQTDNPIALNNSVSIRAQLIEESPSLGPVVFSDNFNVFSGRELSTVLDIVNKLPGQLIESFNDWGVLSHLDLLELGQLIYHKPEILFDIFYHGVTDTELGLFNNNQNALGVATNQPLLSKQFDFEAGQAQHVLLSFDIF